MECGKFGVGNADVVCAIVQISDRCPATPRCWTLARLGMEVERRNPAPRHLSSTRVLRLSEALECPALRLRP